MYEFDCIFVINIALAFNISHTISVFILSIQNSFLNLYFSVSINLHYGKKLMLIDSLNGYLCNSLFLLLNPFRTLT